MKLKLSVCLIVGGLVFSTQAIAGVVAFPFLSVDINGANTGGGQSIGPTQGGFQPWDVIAVTDEFDGNFGAANNWVTQATPGMTKVFATGQGPVTATLYGVGSSYSARNRTNEDAVAPAPAFLPLERDFVFAQIAANTGYGRNYVKLKLAGLAPNTKYRIGLDNRDINFIGNTQNLSHMAWTDLATLGGLDGPAAWLDSHVSAGASYQSTADAPVGYKNPIPTLARPFSTGGNAGTLLAYMGGFQSTSDASGVLTVYGWSDGDSNDGGNVQRAAVLNGFELGAVPEPASVVLFAVGLFGLVALRRKVR